MTRRRNSSVSSPFALSLVSPSRGSGTPVPWPSICEFPIKSLAAYQQLPSYGDICILAILLILSVVALCAIRENTSETNAEFDSRPFVRFIKRKFFSSSDVLAVAAALAVVPVLGYLDTSNVVYHLLKEVILCR